MSQDHILRIAPELYQREIPDGTTWYDLRLMLWHTLKISELLDAAAELLPRLQHVEIEQRTWVYGKTHKSHLETTYKDRVIWIGKHNLNTAFFHFFGDIIS